MIIGDQISADIKFVGSCVEKVVVQNNIITLSQNDPREFSIDIDVKEIGQNDDKTLIGTVELSVITNVKSKQDKKRKSRFNIVIQGCFESTNTNLSKEKFITMLYVNGGSALYSIARSLICNLSANVYQNGKLLLPMINVIEVLKQKVAQQEVANDEKSKPKSDDDNSDKPIN